MKFLTSVGLPLAFLILPAGASQAAPITFRFSGVIDAVYDPNRYGDSINVGDVYSAAFTIESNVPNQYHPNFYTGLYLPLSATVTVGQVTFTGVQNENQGLQVQAQAIPTAVSLWSQFTSSPDVGILSLGGTFIDWTGTALSSHDIPLPDTAPALSAFQQVYLFAADPSTKREQFNATITSLEITPEPGTLGLVLLGFAMARRRA